MNARPTTEMMMDDYYKVIASVSATRVRMMGAPSSTPYPRLLRLLLLDWLGRRMRRTGTELAPQTINQKKAVFPRMDLRRRRRLLLLLLRVDSTTRLKPKPTYYCCASRSFPSLPPSPPRPLLLL